MSAAWLAFLAAVAVRTAIVLTSLVVGIRLVGKRHVGEMAVHDILLILLMANAVQNAMTRGNGHLSVALVSAGTLISMGWLAAVAFRSRPILERFVSGKPTVLVHRGKVVSDNLRREQVTREQLALALRTQGVARVEDVRLAVLEANGAISVVPDTKPGEER